MRSNPLPKRCPGCGVAFECGMGQEQPCWCSREFAPVMPVPQAGADCYCPDCLAKQILRSRREKSGSPP